jgi:arabinose-5-phosphate isomerase
MLEYARSVLAAEAQAITAAAPRLGASFEQAVRALLETAGMVVATGMGKAGIVAQKVAATLSSTGTPAVYLHPAEAVHGDLGRVRPQDIVLVLSHSGETEEIARLLPPLKRIGPKIVAVTARASSTLGRAADIVIETGEIPEACPLGLAPSASTAVLAAIGDALALTVLKERGFTVADFARYHPAGELGRRLMTVREVMRTGAAHPVVPHTTRLRDALAAITRARAGAASVVGDDGRLAGIFTDGDLRRHLTRGDAVLDRPIGELMTRTPITISPDRLATEAARMLSERKIDELPVVDSEGRPVGMLDVQDLLDIGLL